MYCEDEYTKLKTSLVKPEDGFPSKYSLPYHTTDFSALNTVRLISFSEIASEVHDGEPATAAELRALSDALAIQQKSNTSSVYPKVGPLSEQPLNGSASSPLQHLPSSSGSGTARSKSSKSSNHGAPKSNASSGKQRIISITPSVRSGPPIVSHPPQTSTYEEETASFKHEWERRVGDNSYAGPSFTAPWGEEEVVGGNSHNIDSSNQNTWPTPSSSHRRQSTSSSRRRPPQSWNDSNHMEKSSAHSAWETSNVRPTHAAIQTFDGSWDDQMLEEKSASNPSPPKAPEIDGLAPTPDRPVRSEIALNKSRQRVDLPLPNVSSQDWERFSKRTTRQKLCNEHHLRLACHDRACRYDHSEIDTGLLLALRHTARTRPCDCGPACRRHECFGAHRCPFTERPGGCRKHECPFRKKGLHNIADLDIVEVIPIP